MQICLDRLNELNETNEIFFDFCDNKNELIRSAEDLVNDLDIFNENTPENIEQELKRHDIESDFDVFNANFNNFCRLVEKENIPALDKLNQSEVHIQMQDHINRVNLRLERKSLRLDNEALKIELNSNLEHFSSKNIYRNEISFPSSTSTNNTHNINIMHPDSSFISLCEESLFSFSKILF